MFLTGDGDATGRGTRPKFYDLSKEQLLKALTESKWHVETAAKSLNISKTTISKRMREWGITLPEEFSMYPWFATARLEMVRTMYATETPSQNKVMRKLDIGSTQLTKRYIEFALNGGKYIEEETSSVKEWVV